VLLLIVAGSLLRLGGGLLLGFVCQLGLAGFGCGELGLESVDTTFGVDDLFLAREERVRRATDVHLYERVFVAVFPLDSVVSLRSALRQKRKPSHVVAKYDRAVICWVYTAFHNRSIVTDTTPLVKGVEIRYSKSVNHLTKHY
jgi:hypothetical protein